MSAFLPVAHASIWLVFVIMGMSGGICGCQSASRGFSVGVEGAKCYPNATCDAGLTCLSNLCVNAEGVPGADDVATPPEVAAWADSHPGPAADTNGPETTIIDPADSESDTDDARQPEVLTPADTSPSASCAGRCDMGFDPAQSCQCNPACSTFGNCCADLCEVCPASPVCDETLLTCVGRCGGAYDPALPCQCDAACADAGNCCSDHPTACPVATTWLDPGTGLVWEDPGPQINMTWTTASQYCLDLVFGAFDDWRLPSISELRTLVRGCETTHTGGVCQVSDACAQSSCRDDTCEGCEDGEGPSTPGGFYWPDALTGTRPTPWSATPALGYSTDFESVWCINFATGFLGTCAYTGIVYMMTNARCVRGP